MEIIPAILLLIQQDTHVAKLDTKYAFYSISIHESCQKRLKFQHKTMCYITLRNEYTGDPGKRNKLFKLPLSHFRKNETF